MARFPFRRSVGQNLRQLFAHDRLLAQSNQLGYSSLSPGEGMAEVRDADGNTLAGFGHAAGRAGFLIPSGGSYLTVAEWVAQQIAAGTASLNGRVGTLEGRADAHASRLGGVENRASSLEGRADAHVARIGSLEGRADSHASRIGSAETDIGHSIGRLDAHAARLGSIEGVNSSQSSRLGTLEGRADSAVSRIGRSENDIDKIIGAFNQLKERVGDLDGGSKVGLPPNQKG